MKTVSQFDITTYRGKSLMEWAVEWFTTDNDTFFSLHGFNFNPHDYPGLYEEARRRVYPEEPKINWGRFGM